MLAGVAEKRTAKDCFRELRNTLHSFDRLISFLGVVCSILLSLAELLVAPDWAVELLDRERDQRPGSTARTASADGRRVLTSAGDGGGWMAYYAAAG